MEIIKASREDALCCYELRREAILYGCRGHYADEDLEKWVSGDMPEWFKEVVEHHFYLIRLDNEYVATGFLDEENSLLEAIFVKPAVMGKGVGRAMVRHLEGIAISKGFTELGLEATLNAAPFYRSCGYGGAEREQASVYHSPKGVSLASVTMSKSLSAPTASSE